MAVGVSVVIAAYNAADFIKRSVNSAQNQDFESIEIIVVDDKSTDQTLPIVREMALADRRIHVFEQDSNQGPAAARNRGIKEARGKWIAILDADDAYLPERIGKLVAAAEASNLDFIADNLLLYDVNADSIAGVAFNWGQQPVVHLNFMGLLQRDIVGRGNPLGWIQPMIRRDFLDKHELSYGQGIRHGEDFVLCAEILLHGANAALYNEALYIVTTRMGLNSRKQSGWSRTNIDLVGISESCQYLITRYNEQLSHGERELLVQRRQDFLSYNAMASLRKNISERNFSQALADCLRNASHLPFMAKFLASRLSERFFRAIGRT